MTTKVCVVDMTLESKVVKICSLAHYVNPKYESLISKVYDISDSYLGHCLWCVGNNKGFGLLV